MPDDLDLLAAIGDDPQGERIAAVLADLQQVRPAGRYHWDGCWRDHVACLAARVRATLTGEDTTDAAAR